MKVIHYSARWLLGFCSLLPIVYVFRLGAIEIIWNYVMLAMMTFIALCYVAEPFMVRLIAMPRPFRLEENWGPRSAAMQSVTYAGFHTHWFSNMTHASIGWEAVLWLVLVQSYGGTLALMLLLGLLIWQSYSFREQQLSSILALLWVGLAALSMVLYWVAPESVVYWSKVLLLSFAVWRWVGHFVEPIPPGLISKTFTPTIEIRNPLPLIPAFVLGALAELCAGLPYRLFHFWAMYQLQRIGFRPKNLLTLRQVREQLHEVKKIGWAGSSATSELVERW